MNESLIPGSRRPRDRAAEVNGARTGRVASDMGHSGEPEVVVRSSAVLLSLVSIGCAVSELAPTAPSSDLDALRERIVRTAEGAPADEVRRVLGEPDEIRREGEKLPWTVGASEEWAYGVIGGKGGFAAAGLVLLDAERRVFMTLVPSRSGSLRAGADGVAAADAAAPCPSGMCCRLELVRPDGDGVVVKVTLVNGGDQRFAFPHDHTGIGGNLVTELFDADGRLLCRTDRLTWHSPYEPDPARWPVLTVEPGRSAGEEVRLGSRWSEFGRLPAGRYTVRVAFPFEEGVFCPSNRVAFEPGGGSR